MVDVVCEGDVLAGKYRIDRILGSGGTAAVYAATHLDLQQVVAIKVVLPSLAENTEQLRRLFREARVVAQMKSPHVARVFDVGTLEGGLPFMVMEMLEGSDLASCLELRGALPIGEATDYVVQACEAVAEAHSLGIIHRDLKPGNMFLAMGVDKRPLLKVLDFGLSMYTTLESGFTQITQPLSVMGTPAYMSPEQLRSTHDVDARTDIWSIGVLLYELITGRTPWRHSSIVDLCAAILRDPPAPLDVDAPASVEAAIATCLQKDPKNRFPKIGILAAALAPLAGARERAERILRVQPVTNMPPAVLQSPPILIPAPHPERRGSAKAKTVSADSRGARSASRSSNSSKGRATKSLTRSNRRLPRIESDPGSGPTETIRPEQQAWTLTILGGIDKGRVYTEWLLRGNVKGKPASTGSRRSVFRIGRSSSCSLVLLDRGVSRYHATLTVAENAVVIQDEGAKNGTFVNGNRIEKHALRDGDVIQFGPLVSMRFVGRPAPSNQG
jgi:serine/threonine-protein kinase